MDKNALCLSLLNGQFKAAAMRKGAIAATWERAEPLEDLAGLAAVLREAGERTRPASRRVALVLAHPRLSHQIVEVPPARGWAVERFLERRVQTIKPFDGQAAWSSQPALPTRNANARLVDLLPKAVVEQIGQGCAAAGLQLERIIPATAVLSAQLRELPLEKDEVALLAAVTGPTTTVVIGRRDGRVCLARVLSSTWSTQPERVAMDLTRTVGFVNQQSGLAVSSAWLFGAGAELEVTYLSSALKMPVRLSPVPASPFYWAEQALKLPVKDDGNLVSREAREAPLRRRMLAVTAAVVVLVLVASLAGAGFLEVLRRNELDTIAALDSDIAKLQRRVGQLEQREARLKSKRELVEFVRDGTLPPVPGWFLGYVSEAVPQTLVLTQLRVARTNDHWLVNLAGTLHPTTNAAPATILRQAVTTLTNELATGPFHLKIHQSNVDDAPAHPAGPKHQFSIEGVAQ